MKSQKKKISTLKTEIWTKSQNIVPVNNSNIKVNKLHFFTVAAGFICHPECASLYSCWGNGDHQCQDCRHYSYLNRCVANCSVVIDTLPPRDPGVLVDEGNLRCEPCHPQCQGGCNGTVSAYESTIMLVRMTMCIRQARCYLAISNCPGYCLKGCSVSKAIISTLPPWVSILDKVSK